ncbi:transmembrane protein 87A [Elysia marginata]|uniref:Transmembrane protein 87A n=1 Tax=Elysia marginata TaxID=1093978 RepID=A0AAV4HRY5_9GAST|nr:transmembrane protein 87A [Elysia marginata]
MPAFSKTMFKDTQISVSILCEAKEDVDVAVTWMLRRSPCAGEFTDMTRLDQHNVVKVWEDGYYLFMMRFDAQPLSKLKLQVTVRMSLDNSYISAGDWPLLIFYGVMGLVYVFYGIFWLVMLACNWRDLLRVQFWISAVILLGMLEKAVFFAEYENVNKTGQSVHGAVIFAELVSCVKRTLARMLVIIVSLGYGIVKPRLGQAFHKVLIVGGIFFILASIEACLRASADKADQSKPQMISSIPLAVTEAIICWWISFVPTSIAYMVWFLTQHRFTPCITDWKELWMDEAFWHFLFSVILFIIMILWRPTINNQRYAFSPLLDAAEDDIDDDPALSEAYDGMKMRSTKPQQRNGSSARDEQKAEDDLKWVEENIPSSIVDKVLPALDSDEEIMNTKFETSKME